MTLIQLIKIIILPFRKQLFESKTSHSIDTASVMIKQMLDDSVIWNDLKHWVSLGYKLC